MRGSATSRASRPPISWRSSSSSRWSALAHARCSAVRRAAARLAAARDTGLLGEALDDVALRQVVVPGEADAALEVRGHLADVVAEPAQRLDPVRGDELAAAPDAGAAADDAAVGDVAAGDDRALADPEDLADLGATLDDLDDLGLEHALEGRLDVVGELVDDVVQRGRRRPRPRPRGAPSR